MKHNRLVGLLLIAISAITLWQCSDEKIFSMTVIVLAIIGAFSNINIKMRTSRKVIALLVMALLFAVYYRISHQGGSFFSRSAIQTQWLTLSKYFMMVSVFYLFVNRKGKMPPAIILFLSISVLISPQIVRGDMPVNAVIYTFFFVVAAILFCASGLHYRVVNYSGINSKVTIFVLIFTFSIAVGWIGGNLLNIYGESFIDYLMRYHPAPHLFMRGGGQGNREMIEFGYNSSLDSIMRIKAAKSKKIMVRVFSENTPGYLRMMPYTVWNGHSWSNSDDSKSDIEDNTNLVDIADPTKKSAGVSWNIEQRNVDNVFEIEPYLDEEQERYLGKFRVYDIWPSSGHGDAFYTPLDTLYVRAPAESLQFNKNKWIWYAGDHYPGQNYQIASPVGYVPLKVPRLDQKEFLQLPDDIDWDVHALAEKLTNGLETSSAKMSAIKRYFQENYQYSLDVKIPRDRDPITYFLLNQPDAYCEYFAAGTALLLRLSGVPCRYVTGVVVNEKDTITECWVARQRDAHAWVEAWDDAKKQWVIVESTPASGVPQAEEGVSLLANYIDYFKFKFQEFRLSLGVGGFNGLRMWVSEALYHFLKWLFTTVPGMIVLLIVCLLLSGRAKAKLAELWQIRNIDPKVREMNRRLTRMDRKLSRFGLRRLPEETVRAFAKRIDESDHPKLQNKKEQYIEWYIKYEANRYTLFLSEKAS